ncbi:FLU1-II [Fomitopsis serialis]|uniref:FLU1-II n=1 Tax=Fomitopsis serialis TaxID=139415 RepID=UPI002008803B|nr:FLU1-II [Neoantrodia serialis]KAH9914329.1 FLU1-II [Neoantrodia serialis]
MDAASASSFAVAYAADHGSPPRYTSVDDLRLQERGIKHVRVQFVDYSNTVRFWVLPVSYFKRICKLARPSMTLSPVALAFVGIRFASGFNSMGECLFAIDLNSFRVCTYAPGHAVVSTWLQEKVPSPTGALAIPLCPRTMLQKVVDEAKEKAGLTFLVGFESEFVLLKKTSSPPELVNDAGWGCSAGYRTGAVENSVLDEIVDCVEEAGIEVHFMVGEAAPGQYELVTGPMSPLDAADALVFTRETIYNIAHKHGLRATFAPRLLSDNIGSGAHMHLSLHSTVPFTGPDTRSDAALAPELTPTQRSFLQTLVEHIASLSAITLPTNASYKRVEDGIFSGGTYACWGWHNKDAPVRICGDGRANHFEVKTIDGTSNPYLVSAGILAAGLEGVLNGAELKTGNCAIPAAQMSEEERKAVGLENPRRFPRTVSDARQMLDENQYLKEALGAEFVGIYLGVSKLLEEHMTLPTEEATVIRLVETF